MTYDRYENIAVAEGFDIWFEQLTQNTQEIIDDILPQVIASGDWGHHGYDGKGLSWHHGYDGMGVF